MAFKQAIALSTALFFAGSSVAFAAPALPTATATQQGALAPGQAAGVKTAQSWMADNTALIVLGAVVVIGGIALIASNGNSHHASSATSTGAP